MYTINHPSRGTLRLTHLIYALHAFAVVSGILGSATIIGSFVASLPSLLAIVLNYWNRRAVRGTYLESHFQWQINTFWMTLGWLVIFVLAALTIIGLPFVLLGLVLLSCWVVYRVARGWWNLLDGQPLPIMEQ